MIDKFKSFIEEKINRKFINFKKFYEWTCESNKFWHFVSEYFNFEDYSSEQGISFNYKSQLKKLNLDFTEYPKNSSLYKNRYVPSFFINPAKYAIESFKRNSSSKKNSFIEVHENDFILKKNINELESCVFHFQNILDDRKMETGQRLFYVGDFTFKSFCLFLACLSKGIIWSSSSSDIGTSELEYKINATKPSLVTYTNNYLYKGFKHSLKKKLNKVCENSPRITFHDIDTLKNKKKISFNGRLKYTNLPWDFPALILFTSGSTGRSKPLLMSLNAILLQLCREVKLNYKVDENDTFYYQTSWGWNMWQWQLAAFSLGSSFVSYCGAASYPKQSVFIKKFIDNGITVFGASPSLFQNLLSCKDTSKIFKKSIIRLILSTGAVLTAKTAKDIKKKFDRDVISLSGGTEVGGALLAGYSNKLPLPGWLGGQLLGVKVFVGQPNADKVGELFFKSSIPALPLGLVNLKDKRNIETAYLSKNLDIWMHGDLIKQAQNGQFKIIGRSDNVIKRKGIRIGPEEISVELYDKLGLETCCFGVTLKDDEILLCLIIKKTSNFNLKNREIDIKETIKENLGYRHVPDFIVEVDHIPRNSNGKVILSQIRNQCNKYVKNIKNFKIEKLKTYIKNLCKSERDKASI